MPAIDEDGLSPAELRALREAFARDPALAEEIELILPALAPGARVVFCRELASAGAVSRPAGAVLTALVAAARR